MKAIRHTSMSVLLLIGLFIAGWVALVMSVLFPHSLSMAFAHYDVSDIASSVAIFIAAVVILRLQQKPEAESE